MDLHEFLQRLRSLGYEALQSAPSGTEADELYPFVVVSLEFVGPFQESLRRLGSDGDNAAAAAEVQALAQLMEEVLDGGEDATADALATRVVDPLLCRDPAQLALARPYLGPTTVRVVEKMTRLIRSAEAAVAQSRSVIVPAQGRAAGTDDGAGS
jgi:hypothetical protein